MKYGRTLHGVAFPLPTKPWVRERCLGKGVDAPDVPTVKDFIRFSAAASRGKAAELPNFDSVKAFAECFFAGFTRVTGTPTIKEDRTEAFSVSY